MVSEYIKLFVYTEGDVFPDKNNYMRVVRILSEVFSGRTGSAVQGAFGGPLVHKVRVDRLGVSLFVFEFMVQGGPLMHNFRVDCLVSLDL